MSVHRHEDYMKVGDILILISFELISLVTPDEIMNGLLNPVDGRRTRCQVNISYLFDAGIMIICLLMLLN
jgi:hypothetical protein